MLIASEDEVAAGEARTKAFGLTDLVRGETPASLKQEKQKDVCTNTRSHKYSLHETRRKREYNSAAFKTVRYQRMLERCSCQKRLSLCVCIRVVVVVVVVGEQSP